MRDDPLSAREQAVLAFVRRYYGKHGFSPTFREIKDEAGISSTSVVSYQVERLRDRGLINFENGVERSIVPLFEIGETCPFCGHEIGDGINGRRSTNRRGRLRDLRDDRSVPAR